MTPAAVLILVLSFAPTAHAEAMIARLAGPTYAGREKAGRELVRLGRYALPAIRRGETHPDLEVAERCKRLRPLAEVEAVRQRVAQLLAVPPGPPPGDLPRLKRFLEVTGDTREARELYVGVFVAHVHILEDVEHAGDKAGAVFWKAVDKRYSPPRDQDEMLAVRNSTPRPRTVVSRADAALFWLLSADPAVKPYRSDSVGLSNFPVFTAEEAPKWLTGPSASPAMQRLFFAWLTGPRNFDSPGAEASRLKEAFNLTAVAKLEAGRALMMSIATDPAQWHVARAAALVTMMRLGSTEDVAPLSRLVADRTDLGANGSRHCELGDVALAACVILSGQSPGDYGFDCRLADLQAGRAEALDFALRDSAQRATAQEKWSAWAAQQLSARGKR